MSEETAAEGPTQTRATQGGGEKRATLLTHDLLNTSAPPSGQQGDSDGGGGGGGGGGSGGSGGGGSGDNDGGNGGVAWARNLQSMDFQMLGPQRCLKVSHRVSCHSYFCPVGSAFSSAEHEVPSKRRGMQHPSCPSGAQNTGGCRPRLKLPKSWANMCEGVTGCLATQQEGWVGVGMGSRGRRGPLIRTGQAGSFSSAWLTPSDPPQAPEGL